MVKDAQFSVLFCTGFTELGSKSWPLRKAMAPMPNCWPAWQICRCDVLDDWKLSRLITEQHRDLLAIIEERHDKRSAIMTSQLPLGQSYNSIGEPTLADVTLDRLVHNPNKINLKGESMHKRKCVKYSTSFSTI